MVDPRQSLTRSSSTDSSVLSNIDVLPAAAASMEQDSSPDRVSVSTPPTSTSADSVASARKPALERVMEEETGRRSRRSRSSVPTYNLKTLSDRQLPTPPPPATAGSSRNVSGLTGQTLVDGQEEGTPFGDKVDKALDMEWELTGEGDAGPSRKKTGSGIVQRRTSVKDHVKKMAGRLGSVLGKRGRDVMEAGRRKLGMKEEMEIEDEDAEEDEEEDVPRWKKMLDTGAKGLLDEIDLDAEVDMPAPPPAKRARMNNGKTALKEQAQPQAAPVPVPKGSAAGKKMKTWQKEGLFVGQESTSDPSQAGTRKKLQKKRPGSSSSDATTTSAPKRAFMTLPMFNYLDKTRDFTIPYDVFAPSFKKGDEKPKDWHQINKNRLIGEAKELWERAEKLAPSSCVCQPSDIPGEPGCDDQCLNRVMQYECNSDNCLLSFDDCGNRAFSSLTARMKRNNAFDIGVEVLKTPNRGFGVRSCRTFGPGQIIMEYTGEIISEGECQRRMREEYKDKQCYYLMELERGLIIDGTKGSMARFINHSCEPNCEVRMVKVNGTPRMGVFAGENGICTGEELTYDYNFDNFGTNQQVCYCGAPACRGFLSKRLNKEEMKKAAKQDAERKRKAAEAAAKLAAQEERKKTVKSERGSGWRGWVAIDDPETKERLKREKKEKEEAEKNSLRARRLAARAGDGGARRGSLPAVEVQGSKSPAKQAAAIRRKTTHFDEPIRNESVNAAVVDEDHAIEVAAPPGRKRNSRSLSSSARPTSVHSKLSTITRKTEISITETRTDSEEMVADPNDQLLVDSAADSGNDVLQQKKSRPLIEAAKNVVKNGISGVEKGKKKGDRTSASSGVEGSATKKWKQSTLSFGKAG